MHVTTLSIDHRSRLGSLTLVIKPSHDYTNACLSSRLHSATLGHFAKRGKQIDDHIYYFRQGMTRYHELVGAYTRSYRHGVCHRDESKHFRDTSHVVVGHPLEIYLARGSTPQCRASDFSEVPFFSRELGDEVHHTLRGEGSHVQTQDDE